MNMEDEDQNLPSEVPKALRKLETLDQESLNAMTQVEVEEKIRDIADGWAALYYKNESKNGNYNDCVLEVLSKLQSTGYAIDGRIGSTLIGTSLKESQRACRRFFPDSQGINSIEY